MSLTILRSREERLVGGAVGKLLRDALAASGEVVLLVPSLAQALDAQRVLAGLDGLSLGVSVSTPDLWVRERWGVWGDGHELVSRAARELLVERALAGFEGLGRSSGMVALLAGLAEAGLPWLADAPRPEGVTDAEVEAVGVLGAYARELERCGLVEPCAAAAALPSLMRAAGARVGTVVLRGFSELPRAQRELVCGLAVDGEVTVVIEAGDNPSTASGRALAASLAERARELGAQVGEIEGGEAPALARPSELTEVLGQVFESGERPVEATGALRVLLPAGPSAEPELVAREVRSLAERGMRDVVLVAPDPASAWRELAPRLVARGVSLTAELTRPFGSLECGRAFLEFVRAVADLQELARDWPESVPVPDAPEPGTVRVELGDMSWWPPRDLADFVCSALCGAEAEAMWDLDARWRRDRLLTPPTLIERLQTDDKRRKCVPPVVREATRNLLAGDVAAAAEALFGALLVQGGDDALEARAARAAVASAMDTLASLWDRSDEASPKGRLNVACDLLSRTNVRLRVAHDAPGATCVARLMSPRGASRLLPCSADVLVLLAQSTSESPVSTRDDVRSALLAAYGVEDVSDPLGSERARFAALLRVPRELLALEWALHGPDGKERYPSVMATELLVCYGYVPAAKVDDIVSGVMAAVGEGNVTQRSELTVGENVSSRGVAQAVCCRETPAPAGRIVRTDPSCIEPSDGRSPAGDSPVFAATPIESYLECPYKWFCQRRLNLRDNDAGFGPADMGTFAHHVLEVTRRELLARAVERARGTRELAGARADDPRAPQGEEYRALVDELVAEAQRHPLERFEGSSLADEGALAEAREILSAEFDAHLERQYLTCGRSQVGEPRLVAHSSSDHGALVTLRRDLLSLLDYESGLLQGFEPRYMEWDFGYGEDVVTYAGVRLKGTVDRLDVDAHGQALIIDYKYRKAKGFEAEHDALPGGDLAAGLVLPRHVQSLVYAQVVRRAFPDLKLRGSLYLCGRRAHALAGAVDENLVERVFGSHVPSRRRLARLAVDRTASFGRDDDAGMNALLDACEELVAAKIERLLAGDIEPNPVDKNACTYCPVLDCERRITS